MGTRTAYSRLAFVKSTVTLLLWCLLSPILFADLKAVPSRADISYGPDPHQLLDIYLPPYGNGPFPIVIWYGEIWASAKKIPAIQNILSGNCAVIGVEMRGMNDATKDGITPPISGVMLDARRALQFVRLHASEWNLNPQRIAVAGASQGALPALYVACAGEKARPDSGDPVERESTRVTCVGALNSQPTIDPVLMQKWVPGVEWGAPALGCTFAESLQKRDQLQPILSQWSPDELMNRDAPPIFFQNNWGLTKPVSAPDMVYKIHCPGWALGFQRLARQRGVTCYVKYPGQFDDEGAGGYASIWDFLVRELTRPSVSQ